ncbi:hypothetical protein BB559_004821 [Furculomyces boomerangus]|uniref:Ankyrin repeat protein n=1 Tax=Furculomyces boomerangus TaxID=61424 RepID=A0A2T9YCJ6_9FUNG|nr:hypothetical protein BB559_004821 [Furculomyces boomerangus]
MEQKLTYETLCRIFIFANRPDLSLLSHTFYSISKELSVQSDILLKEFGKERCFENTGISLVYPKLAKKEQLVLTLLRKGAVISENDPIYENVFILGWEKVLDHLLKMCYLAEISEKPNTNMFGEDVHVPLYSIKPFFDINNINSILIYQSRKNNHIRILKHLYNAHKIEIDAGKKFGLNPSQMYKGKVRVNIHEEFNFKKYYSIDINEIDDKYYYNRIQFYLSLETPTADQIQECLKCAVLSQNKTVVELMINHDNFSLTTFKNSFNNMIGIRDTEYLHKYLELGIKSNKISDSKASNSFFRNLGVTNLQLENYSFEKKMLIEAFFDSIYNKNIDMVKHYLERGLDFSLFEQDVNLLRISGLNDYFIDDKEVPLLLELLELMDKNGFHWNSRHGILLSESFAHYEIAKFLLERGADTSRINSNALFYSIESGNVESAKLALKYSKKTYNLRDGFRRVCRNNKIEMTRFLLEHDCKACGNLTQMLVEIFEKGFVEIIKLLVLHGADVNTEHGFMLKEALKKNEPKTVNILLDLGAYVDPNNEIAIRTAYRLGIIRVIEKAIENGLGKNKYLINKLLIESISKNDIRMTNFLIENGANPKHNNGKSVIMACRKGNIDLVKKLVEMGVDIRAQKDKGLVLACKNGHYNIAKLAIEHGATFNSNINEILTDSYLAGHKRIIDLLIEYGADQSVIPSCDFLLACKRGDFDKVKNLVECGKVNIQLKENLGLIWSCSLESTDITDYLLKRGANIHARKERALVSACRNGRYHTVELLIKNGAKLTARNNRPLVCAVERNHIDIVNLLTDNNVSFYEKKGHAIYWGAKKSNIRTFRMVLDKHRINQDCLNKSRYWTITEGNKRNFKALKLYCDSIND